MVCRQPAMARCGRVRAGGYEHTQEGWVGVGLGDRNRREGWRGGGMWIGIGSLFRSMFLTAILNVIGFLCGVTRLDSFHSVVNE